MARDESCVFCKITSGQLPCTRVAESLHAFCFMDINPIAVGHALVVPRQHYETVMEMPLEEAADMFRLAVRVGPALREVVAAEGLNILQNNGRCAGQVVGHVHVHLIPRRTGDGLRWPWPATKADPKELARLAEKVISQLEGL
jgi:histidine triad (HIT) family protein